MCSSSTRTVRLLRDRIEQRPLDLFAGHVAGVDDAARTVTALEMEIEPGREVRARFVGVACPGGEIELGSDLAELRDPVLARHAPRARRGADGSALRRRRPCREREPRACRPHRARRDSALGVARLELFARSFGTTRTRMIGGRRNESPEPVADGGFEYVYGLLPGQISVRGT